MPREKKPREPKKLAYAFYKTDWDKEIRESGIQIRKDDLDKMNKTEMVEILRLRGFRVHRGMRRSELVKVLAEGQTRPISNPIDTDRDDLIELFRANRKRLIGQLNPGCETVEGDCYQHTDAQVLVCAFANAPSLRRTPHGR